MFQMDVKNYFFSMRKPYNDSGSIQNKCFPPPTLKVTFIVLKDSLPECSFRLASFT